MRATRYAQQLVRLHPWLYKLAAQAWFDPRWPRHLFIETTAACDLRCAYCPRERRGDHMDFGLFRRIIDEATEHGPRSFSLHLFGEPLLCPWLLLGIDYIKQRHPQHVIVLTTNGTRLNEHVDGLLRSGVDEIIWTVRQEAQLSATTLVKLRQSRTRFRVRILQETTTAEQYLTWSRWPTLDVRPLHNYGGTVDLTRYRRPGDQPPRWPCYHLWYAPAVAWNGDFLICCADPHRQSRLGNINDERIGDLWQDVRLQTLRSLHQLGSYPDICEHCDIWKTYPNTFFRWQLHTSTTSASASTTRTPSST